MRCLASVLTVLATGPVICGCSGYTTPDVGGSFQVITDTIQDAGERRADSLLQLDKYTFIEDNIDQAYRSYAGVQFEYVYSTGPNHGTDTLPAPVSVCGTPAGVWPDPSYCGDFYYDYAAMRRDTLYGYGLFLVNHMTLTDTTTCPGQFSGGASNLPDRNNPLHFNVLPTGRVNRFSFVFVTDIDAKARRCSRDARNTMTFIMVHELGHQRAGLSDNTTYFQGVNLHNIYHLGKLPVGRIDGMLSPADIVDMASNAYPVFDAYDSLSTNDTTSCGGNLFKSRSFVH